MKNIEEKEKENEARSDDVQISAEGAYGMQDTEQVSCQHCGKALPTSTRFCLYCGAPTSANADAVSCPACGAVMPIGTLFCGSCGMSFRASSPVTISGTGTLSFGVPSRALPMQKRRSRIWMSIGVALSAVLLLGVGIIVGRNLLTDSPALPPGSSAPIPTPNSPLVPEPIPLPSTTSSPSASQSLTSTTKDAGGKLPESPPLEKKFQPGFYQIITKERVLVRKEPRLEGEAFAVVSPGRTVDVTAVQGQWATIRSGEKVGHIPREAISSEPVTENGPKSLAEEQPKR